MESSKGRRKPTLDEYLSNSWKTMGCQLGYCTAVHFLGIKVSEDSVISTECASMLKHISVVSRLVNDIQGFKREKEEEGKMNCVTLLLNDGFSLEGAIAKLREMIEYHRKQAMQLLNIVNAEGSLIPKECIELIWRTNEAVWYVYSDTDRLMCKHQVAKDLTSLFQEPPPSAP